MKKVILMLFCVLLATVAFGQKDEDEKTNIKKGKPIARLDQADRIIIDVFTDIWMNKPDDSIMATKAINRGASAYVMRDFPMGKSNFSFAIGAGISCHNMYSNAVAVRESVYDTSNTFGYSFTGKTVFQKLPSSINGTETSYKNNKLTAVYIDIPLEFRFRTKNEGQKFKAAIGFKIGYMLSSHLKYRGDDVVWNYPSMGSPIPSWSLNSEEMVKLKSYKVPNIETYRMGPTVRVGWGWVNVSAYYSLTNLFKKNKGPEMYPISIGLSITPL